MSANKPSMEFLIRQSILNVMHREWFSGKSLAIYTNNATQLPGWLEAAVCREFRALSERWAA